MTAWVELDVEVGGGTRLHCRRAGSGPPVVLLHGMLDDGACWPRVAAALVADHEVVAYDARYHGQSVEAPGAEWGGPDDTLAVVDALGLDRPVLVGHSMGGAVGAQAVAAAPERFRAAVLEDPGWISSVDGPALAVLGSRPWRDVVSELAVPVPLACGGNAALGRLVTAEMADEAAALAPGLAVVTFPEAGHNVRREAFDSFLAAVSRFLADHP